MDAMILICGLATIDIHGVLSLHPKSGWNAYNAGNLESEKDVVAIAEENFFQAHFNFVS
jgi:hypothetical protein